jgi:hypothetical protein
MGRKRVELTAEQIEERKQRYWGPERNAQRRERYMTDPAYRENVIQQVRENYRRQREEQGLPVRNEDCRENLGLIPEIAETREIVLPDGRAETRLTLTVDELADVLSRNTQVVYRWMNGGMFPRPAFTAVLHKGRKQGVYLAEEAAALVNVLGEHQETSQYYRNYHTDTRDKMFGAVEHIRAKMGATNDTDAGARAK